MTVPGLRISVFAWHLDNDSGKRFGSLKIMPSGEGGAPHVWAGADLDGELRLSAPDPILRAIRDALTAHLDGILSPPLEPLPPVQKLGFYGPKEVPQ